MHTDDPDCFVVLIPPGEEIVVDLVQSVNPPNITLFDSNNQVVDIVNALGGAAYNPGSSGFTRATIEVLANSTVGSGRCTTYEIQVVTRAAVQQVDDFGNPATANSTGLPTRLQVYPIPGSSEYPIVLGADQGPPGHFGYLVMGNQVQQLGLPVVSNLICVGGLIGRYNVAGSRLNSLGVFQPNGEWRPFQNGAAVPLFSPYGFTLPEELPTGTGLIMAGQNWGFQLWHRDAGGSSSTSNGKLVRF